MRRAIIGAMLALAPVLPAAASASSNVMQFRLPASDGYTMQVRTEGSLTQITLSRQRPPTSTTYTVAGSAGPGTIAADLGTLGRVDVSFEPSGESSAVAVSPPRRPGCRGPDHVVRQLGTFSGTIAFQGEQGYTTVSASSARGSFGPAARARCDGTGPSAATTSATAASYSEIERIWVVGDAMLMNRSAFSADTSSSTLLLAAADPQVARFLAYRVELPAPGLTITRSVELAGPRADFSYRRQMLSATLRPPAPFSGEATYSSHGRRLSGDLAIAFPGLEPQPLTGPGFEARIEPIR